MEHDDSTLGDLESTLKNNARDLVDSLERGNFGAAVQLINELNKVRDRGLYHEVGKLTRELHNAIVNFQLDPRMPHAQELSQIADATERLNYVVTMTEKAANRTMDLVEQSAPLVNDLSDEAQSLSVEWGRFMRREIGADGFRELAKRVELFLARSERDGAKLSGHLNDILLAQDYQDLTGQVIKRVTQLVTEVESNLLKLMLMASQVDRFAGIQHDHDVLRAEQEKLKEPSRGEGPQIHADKRDDVASSQDDVDDLLSSLGF
ncbi:chemotaxis phosphatase, CheZ [Ectopseudomonas mendocina]|jgi:chemotaxis protein CheZ|uniref:Protein phosphatase CheZ n=1 Tax=Ectopseudomonas mendocina TaxID=300 RepID=A0A379IWK4_ECTME|nr:MULTISPECIES: protein phosphatase CheZ [Pseudomonas]AEB57902.1 chemotaxis phosphatase, CheZ [Pseudomonas mendocina NK-01]MDF2077184.1 protein phosphatase CheZ [Pseudomonas mendocina]QTN45134.1 protein phosphatase CheZ [Pseudomonas mendocina]TRO37740.1 protein phosphatase CheZ [Pseudomonas sp. ALS1131]SUD27282.1 chemotaxis phosphatase, CheZ [Pseudomonas mendocina]